MKKKYLKPDLEVIALETCVTLGDSVKIQHWKAILLR